MTLSPAQALLMVLQRANESTSWESSDLECRLWYGRLMAAYDDYKRGRRFPVETLPEKDEVFK